MPPFFTLAFCLTLLFIATAQPAAAAPITGYALSDFTLINTNANGSIAASPDGSAWILTGPNNGSGLEGTTDLVTTAKAAGMIQFQFAFSTLDVWDPSDPDGPYDYAGYLLGPTFVLLADQSGDSGPVLFAVTMGQTFGFRVASTDNIGEPGILTISAPGGGAEIPEPGTWSLFVAASAAALAGSRIRRAVCNKEKHV